MAGQERTGGGACGHEQQSGRRFCTRCGAPLTRRCGGCGGALEPEARFCGDCGVPVDGAAVPATQAEATPATPVPGPGPEAHGALLGERKQVTVLFADVSGSMQLAEALGPETWAQTMNRFFGLLTGAVEAYGGTVDKFTGDGVMALFGAPVAYEDHARRAGHAALDIIGSVNGYADELRQRHGMGFGVRVGLNSGEVVVGRLGGDSGMEYTALGHTVGLAQRMEAMAEPGRAYLTEHTARLLGNAFRLRDLGRCAVKGSTEPIGVHVLQGSGSRARGLSRWPGRAPLVGRDEELVSLEAALRRALDGQAQVVGVVGEPGMGKSRLCEEFARSVAERGIAVRRASGVSHAQSIALLPVLELLRDYHGITEADTPRAAREKVAGRLLLLDPSLADDLPVLFDFLEIPDPERPAPTVSGEARMRRMIDVLRRVTRRRSEHEPLMLLLEDLHWFDDYSAAFIGELIRLYPGTRTLVVANFRPEFSAEWMRQTYYRQVALGPLPAASVIDLVRKLIGPDESLDGLVPQVAERTGGNPFFVEELLRSLVEDGTLAGVPGGYRMTRPLTEMRVPATVQATLAARIDRLGTRDKDVLQVASVIGRTFRERVLAAVAPLDSNGLDDALRSLCAAEFLQEASGTEGEEYRFWHALTQEVAYGTLLAERRARLHAATAAALIETDPARQDEHAALIALHYGHAGESLEAARWEERAARSAWQRDLAAGLTRWRVAIRHLEAVEPSEDALRIGIRARTQILRIGARAGLSAAEGAELYRQAAELAERLGDDKVWSLLRFSHGAHLFTRGSVGDALGEWLEGLRLAEPSPDPVDWAVVAVGPALTLSLVGPISEALRITEEAMERCSAVSDPGGQFLGYDLRGFLLRNRAEALLMAGRVDEAAADLDRALVGARARGDTEVQTLTESTYSTLVLLSGNQVDALVHAEHAVAAARESGNLWTLASAQRAHAVALLANGCATDSAAVIAAALAEVEQNETGLNEVAVLRVHLARVCLALNDLAAGLLAAGEAVELAHRVGARVVECFALVVRAEGHRRTGRTAEALADIDAAVDLIEATGARVYEPFVMEQRGRILDDDDLLQAAEKFFASMGATGHARRLAAERGGHGPTP